MSGRNTGQRRGRARERIMTAAAERFYTDGIAATGVDAIAIHAGVAKTSLYNNFASKAELVEEYLAARHEEWLALYRRRLAQAQDPAGEPGADAGERVLAVFDAYLDHAELGRPHGFRGCGLLNAAAELPTDGPGRAAVRRHKQQVEEILAEHLRALTDEDRARALAEHCSLLLEGAMVRAGLEGEPAHLERAREIAAGLVAAL
jgi:AcrR family transcriptional regulator